MFRITIKELAQLLNRPRSWVYNALRSINHPNTKGFLDFTLAKKLVEFSFISRSKSSYDYKKLAKPEMIELVETTKITSIPKRRINLTFYYNIIIAKYVISPHMSLSNIIAYINKRLDVGIHDNKAFKKYLYKLYVNLLKNNEITPKYFFKKKSLSTIESEFISLFVEKA